MSHGLGKSIQQDGLYVGKGGGRAVQMIVFIDARASHAVVSGSCLVRMCVKASMPGFD
jgi:hypothetical protein